MWLKEFNGNTKTESGTYNANLLYKKDKFYIMDNHLSATWCWLQEIDTKRKYNYFHIDRHYDLLDTMPNLRQYLDEHKIDLKYLSFEEYLALPNKTMMNRPTTGTPYPLFQFDNYLPHFFRAYPNVIDKTYFATHKDGTTVKDIPLNYQPEIYDVFENINYWLNDKYINEGSTGWIFNLDIDYFFQGQNREFQFLTDEYILNICKEIEKSLRHIKVITIAMSPEFCDGWEKSYRVTKLIADYFSLDFSLNL